ncbi:MAG: hypothetical protein LBK25_09570 [Treponema sp.]|jgi:hypothetical protein|nr:hypothetical protein [Treponema sp.]
MRDNHIIKKIGNFTRKIIGTEQLEKKIDRLETKIYEMEDSLLFGLSQLTPRETHPRFIVTLTSYGKRIYTTVPTVIASIFRQSVIPDKIILWLAEKTITPQLRLLQEYGLEIKFCDDLRSYKKLIPALKEFPEDVLITADDDLYYPHNWLAQLIFAYQENPKNIYCHRAHKIVFDNNGVIKPYEQWRFQIKSERDAKLIFPTSGAGCLYPPHTLDENVVNMEEFMSLAPTADDIWFWAMANLCNTNIEIVKDSCFSVKDIASDGCGETPLCDENVTGGANDRQLRAVMERFPQLKGLPPPPESII